VSCCIKKLKQEKEKEKEIAKRKNSSNSENHFYSTLDKYHDENLANKHHV
jgi:predicted RNA-binding protein YlxR (DUF448 family)